MGLMMEPILKAPQRSFAIAKGWQDSVLSIVETGRKLLVAHKSLSYEDYKKVVVVELGMDMSTAGRLEAISEHPILSNPNYADHLPTGWATLYKLKFVPNETLLRKIKDGSLKTIKVKEIEALRDPVEVIKAKGKNGSRLNDPPNGMQPIEWARSIYNKEVAGDLSPEEAVVGENLGISSYRKMRKIVILSDRTDLSEYERKTIDEAILLINKTKQIDRYFGEITPIITKIWGKARHSHLTPKTEQKRKTAFTHAIVVICDACNASPEIELPRLTAEEAVEAVDRLNIAMKNLNRLRGKVRRSIND